MLVTHSNNGTTEIEFRRRDANFAIFMTMALADIKLSLKYKVLDNKSTQLEPYILQKKLCLLSYHTK